MVLLALTLDEFKGGRFVCCFFFILFTSGVLNPPAYRPDLAHGAPLESGNLGMREEWEH